MTDYNETNKNLNYIQSFFHEPCQVNVITKIGFGEGDLVRAKYPHYSFAARPEFDYQLGSIEPILTIPYENTGDFLTFGWFKLHVMCREQPWICWQDEYAVCNND